MRDMTPEELEKTRKAMYDDLVDLISKSGGISSFSNMQNRHGGWGSNPTESGHHNSYHTPERDEQGTFYGYKILHRHCEHPACDVFVSPRYPAEWRNGELTSDMTPNEITRHGIHFTKRPDHPELMAYRSRSMGYVYPCGKQMWVLVKCALSGTIVETEQGFRAQHAQIIGVLIDGNWQSYSDYSQRATSYSRPNPYMDEEEYRFTLKKREHGKPDGAWYIDWNPNP